MKKLFIIFIGLFISFSVYSQSADVITQILDKTEVTFGDVCYLSAVKQGFVGDDATYEEAINAVYENEQISYLAGKDEIIPLIDITYLFSFMWDIKGGLFYTITKGSPRYVFKQFQSDSVIGYDCEPKDCFSGMQLLRLFTSCEKKYGEYVIQNGGEQ